MYQNTIITYPAYVLANPTLNLAVNGNRIKTYNHDGQACAYLKDGTEFQLEFDNDSDFYVRAEITVNGQTQKSSLVLRPHQRYFLDRFMDEKKKFKFNTFLTGNDDIEKLKEIIAKNGKILVKFYKEYLQPVISETYRDPFVLYGSGQSETSLYGAGRFGYTTNGIKSRGLTKGLSSDRGENISNSSYYVNSMNISANASAYEDYLDASAQIKPDEMETGRIESGNKSKQEFSPITKTWESWPCVCFQYHILPESQMPKTPKVKKVKKAKDVIMADDVRTYCPKCGRRVKEGWNFCPGCGKEY